MKLRSPWGWDGSFFGVNSSVQECVCWCVLLALNHIQDWSVVTTVAKVQVSPSTFGLNTQLLTPGKCFQPELGYRKAAQTSEQRQECPSSSKCSIRPFLYLQLNTQQLVGREGASVRKGWGMMEEREEAGLEFQHLLELYLLPMQQYWPKEWRPLLLPCLVLISPLVIGQRWSIEVWLIWSFFKLFSLLLLLLLMLI